MTQFSCDKRALVLVLVLLTCCCGQGSYRTTVDPITRASAEPSPAQSVEVQAYIPDQFGQLMGDFIKTYTDEDRLSYLDYEVNKSKRVARTKSQKGSTEIEYAVLRRKGKVVAQFDSSLDRLTRVRFGLFAFLGHKYSQLVIEQSSEKFWRYWVVSLEPDFRVIYDSGKYDLVYELRVTDVDGDGYSEIVQNLGSLWYFASLDNLYSPRPPIIFTYDSSERIYVPANKRFQQLALKDIEERITKTGEVIERKDDPASALHVRSAVLDVVLRYLYSGKTSEAWTFYDRHYKIEDKETLRVELIKKLGQDKLYQSLKEAGSPTSAQR